MYIFTSLLFSKYIHPSLKRAGSNCHINISHQKYKKCIRSFLFTKYFDTSQMGLLRDEVSEAFKICPVWNQTGENLPYLLFEDFLKKIKPGVEITSFHACLFACLLISVNTPVVGYSIKSTWEGFHKSYLSIQIVTFQKNLYTGHTQKNGASCYAITF